MALAGCTPPPPSPAPLPALATTTQTANKSDTAFMQLTNETDLLAESLGRNEGSFGSSACVQAFAGHSVGGHEANRIAMVQAAGDASVTVTDTLSTQDNNWLRATARQRGAAADQAYLHALLVTDRALLDQASIEASGSPMPGLKTFAKKTQVELAQEIDELRSRHLPCYR